MDKSVKSFDPSNANTLAHAIFYASNYGWQVLPLNTPIIDADSGKVAGCSCGNIECDEKNIGKHPRYDDKLLREGLKSASSNLELIREWWNKWPDANVGIVTGERSGLVVMDVDNMRGKRTVLSQGRLPYTATAKSGVGFHYYFKHPGFHVKSTVNVFPGIDSRADGGFICSPPSLHYRGFRYEWLDAVNLAEAPRWWIDKLEEMQRPESRNEGDDFSSLGSQAIVDHSLYGEAALRDELRKIWECPKGVGLRNTTLYKSSAALFQLVAAGMLDEGKTETLLTEAALSGMGMSATEARKTIGSGKKWGISHPRNSRSG